MPNLCSRCRLRHAFKFRLDSESIITAEGCAKVFVRNSCEIMICAECTDRLHRCHRLLIGVQFIFLCTHFRCLPTTEEDWRSSRRTIERAVTGKKALRGDEYINLISVYFILVPTVQKSLSKMFGVLSYNAGFVTFINNGHCRGWVEDARHNKIIALRIQNALPIFLPTSMASFYLTGEPLAIHRDALWVARRRVHDENREGAHFCEILLNNIAVDIISVSKKSPYQEFVQSKKPIWGKQVKKCTKRRGTLCYL